MAKIQRALLSVSDKTGLVDFARRLAEAGIQLLSTGGTARALREAGLQVQDLSDYTGFPEMLDGRVKTLHPKVHGGLLFRRGYANHEAAVKQHGIQPIDLVVVNLYPFEKTVADASVSIEVAIENIDIGGPSMLRSAAKNHESVTVIMDPADYAEVAEQIAASGETSLDLRRRLAIRVFARTTAYDAAIAAHLIKTFLSAEKSSKDEPPEPAQSNSLMPPELLLHARQTQSLRYGENPHQSAALYGRFEEFHRQLHGKELSYNNILDLSAAAHLISEFNDDPPTLAILKHTNPCGMGQGTDLREAWEKALATDRQAPFGGIIAVNRPLDGDCARAISEIFSEVIVAPSFTDDALEVLRRKKNLRLIQIVRDPAGTTSIEIRTVGPETYLAQERDAARVDVARLKVVTKRPPTPEDSRAMQFGWRVVKHVKSNAIVYAAPDRTLGIGAGQMSRVDSSRIAVWKAGAAGLDLKGSVICSDAFFPFADGLNAAADAGATASIQPGGSVRDAEVIAAANERNMAMVFTGIRHFRH
jgi:phosphoribosylaminoimidazolecarboxamide formyltransferase/IMP cyclohydrolase